MKWRLVASLSVVMILLFSFSLPGTAHAADVVVTPDAPNGWGFLVETGTATGEFVIGPGAPPAGAGSYQITLDDAASGAVIGTQQFTGVRLDELTTLQYSTYNSVGNNTVAPALQINIDYDLTDTSTGWQGRLVFEPYADNTVVDGTWQTWDALAGRWWSTGNPIVGDAPATQHCPISAPCDLPTILGFYPDAGVQTGALSGLMFKAGSGWLAGYTGSVDNFTIGINGANDTFNFEPLLPQLTINKAGPASVPPGTTFDYTINVQNTGSADATGVTLTDTLPPEVTYVSDTQGCGAGVTCNVGTLTQGGAFSVTITVEATGAEGDTAVNQATVDSNETAAVDSNVINTAIAPGPIDPGDPIDPIEPVEPTEPETPVEAYTPPPATCDIMDPNNFSAGGIPDGTYCRIMMQDGRNMANDGAVPQALTDNGVILALEIYRLQGGQSIATFDNYAQFCIFGEGRLVYRDATGVPRQSVEMPVTMVDGYACTWIPNPGTLILVEN